MILACKNISKSFGTDQILNSVSFHVNEREKAAVIGINGAGKSTLFKIIMGELTPDEGEIVFAKGCTVGYLAQHQGLSSENSIYDEILTIKKDVIETENSIRELEASMKGASKDQLEQMLASYSRLTHEFESKNGYSYKSEVIGILRGLGFSEEEFHKPVSTLSGGQKTRVALGKLLLSKPDLILLDEPTNHLDMESIAWLETFLLNYPGSVVVIAHDRYFLDKVVTKVVELEQGKAVSYEGNYTAYADKKAMLRDAMLKHYLNQQREIKHQEEVITKLRSFNREKSIRRAESREKMLEKVERLDKPATYVPQMNITLEPHVVSGNDVLKAQDLSKSFGNLTLFKNLNFEIKRSERVAIIGNNGTGKTTLLKIINELIPADSGSVTLGSKVKIGYYDQEHQILDSEKTLFDELSDAYPNMDNTSIRNVLAAFLFTGDDVFKRIKDISGGEKGRVSLAKLMLSEANLLILDEPTNHLDIASKEILENAVSSYSGTVLYVSHDRYFINKTATRIMDLTGNTLINYIGNYDYYLEKRDELEAVSLNRNGSCPSGKSTQAAEEASTKQDWMQKKEEQARIRKRQNDLKKLEDEIQKLELRNSEIDNLLAKEEIYTNSDELVKLTKERKSLEETLEKLMKDWELLVEE